MARDAIEVARDVFVMTSARANTTSTLVRHGDRVMLVDPAWSVSELDSLRDWIADRGWSVASGVCTHAHHDHLLWHPDFAGAPRWASPGTVACAGAWHDELTEMLDDDYRAAFPDWTGSLSVVDGTELPEPFGDDVAEHIQLVVHDGHSPGHTAVWLADRRVLVAGDMLSDLELPLPFDPDDLGAYLVALDELAPAVRGCDVLIPGHGNPTDRPLRRLDADRRYLDAVLRGADPDDPRRGNDGMDEAHRRVVQLARGHAARDGRPIASDNGA